MTYDHVVKFNGEYYQAGMEVPETDAGLKGAESLPFSDEDIMMETEPVKRGRPRKNS